MLEFPPNGGTVGKTGSLKPGREASSGMPNHRYAKRFAPDGQPSKVSIQNRRCEGKRKEAAAGKPVCPLKNDNSSVYPQFLWKTPWKIVANPHRQRDSAIG
ncbi:MAG: hypothetical protein ACOYMG_05250 [Candidatus Methylumidiphilus sp.]